MRWIPLHPRWAIVPIVAAIVLAARVEATGGSLLLVWGIMLAAITAGTLAADAWYERRGQAR